METWPRHTPRTAAVANGRRMTSLDMLQRLDHPFVQEWCEKRMQTLHTSRWHWEADRVAVQIRPPPQAVARWNRKRRPTLRAIGRTGNTKSQTTKPYSDSRSWRVYLLHRPGLGRGVRAITFAYDGTAASRRLCGMRCTLTTRRWRRGMWLRWSGLRKNTMSPPAAMAVSLQEWAPRRPPVRHPDATIVRRHTHTPAHPYTLCLSHSLAPFPYHYHRHNRRHHISRTPFNTLPPSLPTSTMAFVGSAVALPATARPTAAVVSTRSSTFVAPLSLAATPTARGAAVMMAVGDENRKFNKTGRDAEAKIEAQSNRPQGWTRFSEVVNGRGAMVGFASGLVVEILTGRSIYEQVVAWAELPVSLIGKIL